MDLLDSHRSPHPLPLQGRRLLFHRDGGGLVRENAAWSYETPFPAVEAITEHLAFYPEKVDAIEEFND